MFDIFMACAEKDFDKLPYSVKGVADNIVGFDKLFICSPVDIPPKILAKLPIAHYTNLDESVFLVDRKRWRYRPNWCYQQHLKLFQEVTADWYLTLDCDVVIRKKMEFFDGDRPICWKGTHQYYPPYFKYQKEMIGLDYIQTHSFVADMNLFNRKFICEMVERSGHTVSSFIEKSQAITTPDCHLGEPELYGQYCLHTKKPYVERFFKTYGEGRVMKPGGTNPWTVDDMESFLRNHNDASLDTVSMHTWYDEGDQR